ncbi:MAG: hypothetical protein A2Y34_08855 [Spirochaetes bacterium GWC1_27_15]|nr:MAG: hypothetical protein A2Y34_08855 [Spirochaetes bacterium GWC1_27_15]
MSRFKDKVVIITGGGRGIGKVLAKSFAREEALLAICSRTKKQIDEVAEECAKDGHKILSIPCDVSKQDEVEKLVKEVMKEYNRVDILINCAGSFMMSPSLLTDISEINAMYNNNYLGTFLMSQAVGRIMIAQGYGKIINMASLLSFIAFPERASYAASKGAVLQLTRVLGVEWADKGINVNAIAPGMIKIETPHPIDKTEFTSKIEQRVPAKRVGTPNDIVGPIFFLASEDSNYINGQTIVVDGGWLSYGYL